MDDMINGCHGWLVRAAAGGALLGMTLCAQAQVTCDQLVASAKAGIALRDQGATLRQVLSETETGELRKRFQPDDLGIIRQALRLTYTGEVSLHELAETCAENARRDGAQRK